MNATAPVYPNEFIFRHFQAADLSPFLAMVADTEIKAYFDEFNWDEEIIAGKFDGINDDIPYVQYWGIFLPDGALAGFISLKKNGAIQRTLQKLNIPPPSADDEFEFFTDEQLKRREWREKVGSPYCADIAIHPGQRRKGIARKALAWLSDYAAMVGLKEIYLEVREDNIASAQLIAGTTAELIVPAPQHHGHDLYRLPVLLPQLNQAAMKEEENMATDSTTKEVLTTLRYCLRKFPALIAQKELLLELLWAIKYEDADLKAEDNCRGCSHQTNGLIRRVIVCLAERPEPLTLIWSLAHELGHLQQEDATEKEKRPFTLEKFRREEDAWKKAEAWLNDKPLFWYQWESFFRFRHDRLNSYTPSCA